MIGSASALSLIDSSVYKRAAKKDDPATSGSTIWGFKPLACLRVHSKSVQRASASTGGENVGATPSLGSSVTRASWCTAPDKGSQFGLFIGLCIRMISTLSPELSADSMMQMLTAISKAPNSERRAGPWVYRIERGALNVALHAQRK
jgi:hypothetical protein